jgi:hypothetical protein
MLFRIQRQRLFNRCDLAQCSNRAVHINPRRMQNRHRHFFNSRRSFDGQLCFRLNVRNERHSGNGSSERSRDVYSNGNGGSAGSSTTYCSGFGSQFNESFNTGSTVYTPLIGAQSFYSGEAYMLTPWPTSCVMSNFFAYVNPALSGDQQITFTFFDNSNGQPLTMTCTAASQQCSDTNQSHNFNVSPGDLLTIQLQIAGSTNYQGSIAWSFY